MESWPHAPRSSSPFPGSATVADAEGARWRDIHKALEIERVRASEDLRAKQREQVSLADEVRRLNQELQKEKHNTETEVRQFQDRLECAKRERTLVDMRLMKVQVHGTTCDSDKESIRRQVTDGSNEILECMTELREQQQRAFKQVKELSQAMLRTCAECAPIAPESREVHVGTSPGVSHSRQQVSETFDKFAFTSALDASQIPSGVIETSERFKSVKANLEKFGNVEVFVDRAQQKCMACMQPIADVHRVMLRKCGHKFHVECILKSWTEGTCPVCHASFAPDEAAEI